MEHDRRNFSSLARLGRYRKRFGHSGLWRVNNAATCMDGLAVAGRVQQKYIQEEESCHWADPDHYRINGVE